MEIFDKPCAAPVKSNVDEELEKYLTSKSMIHDEGDDDILLYWRENREVFPLIASIAREVLAIPASNTSVERLFSLCKNTVTDKRTRLGAEKLNKLMFSCKRIARSSRRSLMSVPAEKKNDHDAKRKQDATNSNEPTAVEKNEITQRYA